MSEEVVEGTTSRPSFHHSEKRQFRWINIIHILIMGLGSIAYGYSASVISTTLVQPGWIASMGLAHRSNAKDLIGLTGSMYQVGGLIGTFTMSYFADRWGRRVGIAVPTVVTIVCAALLAGSVNIEMFITFRFFAGMAAYSLVAAVPVWISEVAPPSVRGIFVDLHATMLLIGYMMAAAVGYGFWLRDAAASWRGLQAVNIIPAVLLLVALPFLPESPRWLLMKDRREEAAAVLNKLHTPDEARVEFLQIESQVKIDRTLPASYLALFKKASYRKRAILSFGTVACIQMTGPLGTPPLISHLQRILLTVLVLNNYGPTIYAALGFNANQQFIYQIGWLATAVGASFVALLIVERFPRPKLMAFGIQFCLVCLACEAALVATYASPAALLKPNSAALKAAVAMLFVHISSFQICLDGTEFVYISEVCPTHLRAKGIALGMAGLCVMNIIWLQVAPTAFANIGWKFYLCFIIPGTVGAVWMFFWFPDTRGLPLEEVADIFGDRGELYGRASSDGPAVEQDTIEVDVENKSHAAGHVEKL